MRTPLFLFAATAVFFSGANTATAQTLPVPPPAPSPAPPASVPRSVTAPKIAVKRADFTKPRLLWKTFLRRCDSTPLVRGERIFTGAGRSLYALDTGGHTLWATETGNQQSSPVADENRVYIGSDRGILYAMNPASGDLAWQMPGRTNNTFLTAPALGDGKVFAEGTDNFVYAVDSETGVLKWKFPRPDGSLGYAAPLSISGALYVCGETNLYRLNPDTGQEIWRVRVGGKSLATPTTDERGRQVFVGGDGAGLSAWDTETGKRLWTFAGERKNDWFGPPLYAGGVLYVSTYNRYVYAVDAATGELRWQTRTLGPALSQPTLDSARGVVYVTAATFKDNPTLWALDSRTGKTLWNFRGGYLANSAVVDNDRLYVGSLSGQFYAFSLATIQ